MGKDLLAKVRPTTAYRGTLLGWYLCICRAQRQGHSTSVGRQGKRGQASRGQDCYVHLKDFGISLRSSSVIIEAHHVFAVDFTCCLVSSLAMISFLHGPCARYLLSLPPGV